MKTSYVYKNRQESVNTESSEQKVTNRSAVDAYVHLRSLSQEMASQRAKKAEEGTAPKEEIEEVAVTPQKPKKKKKLGLIIGISAAVVVIGIGGMAWYRVHTNKQLNESYATLCANLNAYYLDDPSIGLAEFTEADVEHLRETLNEYAIRGIDTSDVSVKLMDISHYVYDMESLDKLKSSDSLSSDTFAVQLDVVKQSVESNYTVDTVRNVVKSEIDAIESQVATYVYVKDALLAMTDLSPLTDSTFSAEINSLSYVDNISELNVLKNKMLSTKGIEDEYSRLSSEYESALSELNDMIGALEEKEGSERQELEAGITEKQEIVNGAKEALELQKQPLRDARLEVAKAKDTLVGGTTYVDKLVAEWALEDQVLENSIEGIEE